eukprot:3582367-Alexandrium_andersonii.AAC.1
MPPWLWGKGGGDDDPDRRGGKLRDRSSSGSSSRVNRIRKKKIRKLREEVEQKAIEVDQLKRQVINERHDYVRKEDSLLQQIADLNAENEEKTRRMHIEQKKAQGWEQRCRKAEQKISSALTTTGAQPSALPGPVVVPPPLHK